MECAYCQPKLRLKIQREEKIFARVNDSHKFFFFLFASKFPSLVFCRRRRCRRRRRWSTPTSNSTNKRKCGNVWHVMGNRIERTNESCSIVHNHPRPEMGKMRATQKEHNAITKSVTILSKIYHRASLPFSRQREARMVKCKCFVRHSTFYICAKICKTTRINLLTVTVISLRDNVI